MCIVISSFLPISFSKWLENHKKWTEWKEAVITFAHAVFGNKLNYDWRALPKKIWRNLLDVQQWGQKSLLHIELVSTILNFDLFFGKAMLTFFDGLFILTENFLDADVRFVLWWIISCAHIFFVTFTRQYVAWRLLNLVWLCK